MLSGIWKPSILDLTSRTQGPRRAAQAERASPGPRTSSDHTTPRKRTWFAVRLHNARHNVPPSPVPAVTPMQTTESVSLQLPCSVALSQQETKPGSLAGHGRDGRFCFRYKEAETVSTFSVFEPSRLPLRTLHCLGVALFNLFVSAKYLALNCNSP